jgi:hypothetical protein
MRRPRSSRLNSATAEALLDGHGPDTSLTWLLAAATAPGRAEEIAGEAAARAAFAAARPTQAPLLRAPTPRRGLVSRLIAAKAAVLILLAAGATGGVALAANAQFAPVPGAAERPASSPARPPTPAAAPPSPAPASPTAPPSTAASPTTSTSASSRPSSASARPPNAARTTTTRKVATCAACGPSAAPVPAAVPLAAPAVAPTASTTATADPPPTDLRSTVNPRPHTKNGWRH